MDNFYSIQNDTKISTLLDLKGLPDDFIKNSNKINLPTLYFVNK